MAQKKEPMRMCVITREKFSKRELLRVVRTPEGEVVFDKTGKKNGKGVYLKKDIEVINKTQKNKMLDKALEVKVADEVFEELRKEIN